MTARLCRRLGSCAEYAGKTIGGGLVTLILGRSDGFAGVAIRGGEVKDKAQCGHPLYWFGCYRGSYDLIAPESYAHPAKMSSTLCYRILQHLKEW